MWFIIIIAELDTNTQTSDVVNIFLSLKFFLIISKACMCINNLPSTHLLNLAFLLMAWCSVY